MRKLSWEGEGEGPSALNHDATARPLARAREIWSGLLTVASQTEGDDCEERLRYSEGEHKVDRHVACGDFRVDGEGIGTLLCEDYVLSSSRSQKATRDRSGRVSYVITEGR